MSWRVAMFVLIAAPAGACGIDTSLKHRCASDEDCAIGHLCSGRHCLPAPRDAGSPIDGPDRSIDATDDGEVDPSATPNYVFVTSRRYSLDWASLEVPDLHCNQAAAAARLPGVYRAWLSTSDLDARDRLAGARGWIRPDGAPFADTVDDIVRGRIFHPPSVDEYRQRVIVSRSIEDPVVTGTTTDGVLQTDGNCRDWSEPLETHQALAGQPDTATTGWTQSYALALCSRPARIYCFGVDRVTRVAPVRAAGKLAFLSSRMFISGDGIESADNLCNREAADANLPGEFLALLARDKVPAATRFTSGERWVRPDGVALNASGTDLFSTEPLAPLNVSASGDYEDRAVLTGGPGPIDFNGTIGNCDDWRGMDPTAVAVAGLASSTSQWLERDFITSCASATSIYCFQR